MSKNGSRRQSGCDSREAKEMNNDYPHLVLTSHRDVSLGRIGRIADNHQINFVRDGLLAGFLR
jgi:hypothetical protein